MGPAMPSPPDGDSGKPHGWTLIAEQKRRSTAVDPPRTARSR